MGSARNGQILSLHGEVVATRSAAAVRAELLRAHRKHEARTLAGHDDELTVEAEAGAILEAETAVEIHELHAMVRAYLEQR